MKATTKEREFEVESPAIEIAEAALDGEAWAVRIIGKTKPVSTKRARKILRGGRG